MIELTIIPTIRGEKLSNIREIIEVCTDHSSGVVDYW